MSDGTAISMSVPVASYVKTPKPLSRARTAPEMVEEHVLFEEEITGLLEEKGIVEDNIVNADEKTLVKKLGGGYKLVAEGGEHRVALGEHAFQAQVAHDCSDNRTPKRSFLLPRGGKNVKQLISVNEIAQLINHGDPVTIAVQRDANSSLHSRHGFLQQFRRRRATTVIDISPVRRATNSDDIGTQLRKRSGPHFIAGTVGAIENDLHAVQI